VVPVILITVECGGHFFVIFEQHHIHQKIFIIKMRKGVKLGKGG